MEKVEITVDVFSECYCEIPTRAIEFMKFWQDKIDQIPSEHMETARVEIDSDYDQGSIDVEISYRRIETDYECTERMEREQHFSNQRKNKDLKLLAELQAKYGTGDI